VVRISRALKEAEKITPDTYDFAQAYPCGPVPAPGMPKEL
jgi:hypothetical protein